MPPTQEERLREEFEKWAYTHTTVGSNEDKDIADFWLSKIADLHKEWVEEARREIEQIETIDRETRYGYDETDHISKTEVLALPSFNPLPTKSEETCGALLHTRGFGTFVGPMYCAEKKPCRWHSNKNTQ